MADKKMILKTPSSSSGSNCIQNIANLLFEAEVVTHILHLQSKKKSYAEHTALGEFYDAICGLNDNLVEKSYVDYGIIGKYLIHVDSSKITDVGTYLREVRDEVMAEREYIKQGFIQQMVDNIIEQISHTIYKLDNLK